MAPDRHGISCWHAFSVPFLQGHAADDDLCSSYRERLFLRMVPVGESMEVGSIPSRWIFFHRWVVPVPRFLYRLAPQSWTCESEGSPFLTPGSIYYSRLYTVVSLSTIPCCRPPYRAVVDAKFISFTAWRAAAERKELLGIVESALCSVPS
jgi:hypothetical protein